MKLLDLVLVVLVLFCNLGVVRADALTPHQKAFVDRYLVDHDLNIYGDAEGTVYAGGSPLFDEATGQCTDRYEYVLRRNPHLLDTFVDTLPVEGVGRLVEAGRRFDNDSDARRVPARSLDRETEDAIQALVESIAAAVEAHDYLAITKLFDRVGQLTDSELRPFATVFKQSRRMLEMPAVQPVEITARINALLVTLDRLEARLH